MSFHEKAQQLKKQSEMTQKDIAEACNISESTVSRYLNGAVVPPEDVAQSILEALGGGAHPEHTAVAEKIEGEEDVQTALAMIRELYEARILDMQDTIKDLKERVDHEKYERWIITIILAVVIAAFFAMIFIDLSNGNIGWFRH